MAGDPCFAIVMATDRDEFDEYLVLAQVPGVAESVVFTTGDEPPHDFEFRLLGVRCGDPLEGGGAR
eukprot:258942-Lingulodinium_polyedra.AAC.1